MGSKAPEVPSSTTSYSVNDPWVMQQPYINYANRQSANLWSEVPGQYYPGQSYAPMNALQQQGLGMRLEDATERMPGYIDSAQNAWQSSLNAPDLGNNPYVWDMIQRNNARIGQDFREQIMPAIEGEAVRVGGVGGSRQGIAEGRAADAALRAMGDSSAQLLSDAYGQGLDAQARGLAFSPQMAALGFLPSDTVTQVGDVLRNEAQMAYGDEVGRWDYRMGEPYDRLRAFAIPTGQSWGGGSASQTSASGGGGSNPIAGAAGGALAGASLGSALTAGQMVSTAFPPALPFAVAGGLLGLL